MDRGASLEEMAAASLFDLPDIKLLDQAETQDQQDYWHQLRAFYSIVSYCWLAKLLNASTGLESLDDPLYVLLEAKKIDKIKYESAWRRADRLQALYRVLEIGEKYVAETYLDLGAHYPFTLFSLFYSIVKIDADNLFKNCLEPYKHISAQDLLTAAKLTLTLSPLQPLKPQEIRQSKRLSSQLQKNYCHDVAILSCASKADQDPQLRQLLVNYCDAIRQEAAVTKSAVSRTRDSKTFKRFRSFTWLKGKVVYANRYGGTYKLNKT
jgi:hypothetical protein